MTYLSATRVDTRYVVNEDVPASIFSLQRVIYVWHHLGDVSNSDDRKSLQTKNGGTQTGSVTCEHVTSQSFVPGLVPTIGEESVCVEGHMDGHGSGQSRRSRVDSEQVQSLTFVSSSSGHYGVDHPSRYLEDQSLTRCRVGYKSTYLWLTGVVYYITVNAKKW